MIDQTTLNELLDRLTKAESKINDLEHKLTQISQAADPRNVRIRDHNQMTIHGFGIGERFDDKN